MYGQTVYSVTETSHLLEHDGKFLLYLKGENSAYPSESKQRESHVDILYFQHKTNINEQVINELVKI